MAKLAKLFVTVAVAAVAVVAMLPVSGFGDTCKAKPETDHCYSLSQYIMKSQDGEYVYGAYDDIESYYGKVPLWYEGNRINNEMWVGLGSEYNTHWIEGGAMIGSGYNELLGEEKIGYFVAYSYPEHYWEYDYGAATPGYNNWYGLYLAEKVGEPNAVWCAQWKWDSTPDFCWNMNGAPGGNYSIDLESGMEFATSEASGARNNGRAVPQQEWNNWTWHEFWYGSYSKAEPFYDPPMCINAPAPGYPIGSVAFANGCGSEGGSPAVASVIPTSGSFPATATTVSEGGEGEVPGSGYKQGKSRLTNEEIAVIAQRLAVKNGESEANSAQTLATATVTDTTLGAAIDANGRAQMYASSPGMEALKASDVAVVVMHGHFTLTDAAVKPGAGEITGKTLTLIIDRSSGAVDASELSPEAPPGLRALGPQQALVSGDETATTASAASHKTSITGEAHVEGPSKVGFVPPAVEHFQGVVVTVSQGSKVVRILKTDTDTSFRIPVRSGTYKVTATLGPPTINPNPRSCGSTTVRIKTSSREVRFVCGLTG
jgi:hypothetical protein